MPHGPDVFAIPEQGWTCEGGDPTPEPVKVYREELVRKLEKYLDDNYAKDDARAVRVLSRLRAAIETGDWPREV